MRFYDLIKKKRDGLELGREEIQYLVDVSTKGEVPDYQITAFLMATFIRGMSSLETSHLTMAMALSGETLDLTHLGRVVDKHSTGGVADTTTLIVTPLVAACGVPVAKMTGRGLGHTGGTVDKLESISGLTTALSRQRFLDQVRDIGIALMSATSQLAPADKVFYALRDVTATVDSIPLIASSIMSKKIAAGASHVVLDVKYGTGAFMNSRERAEDLAHTMVNIGKVTERPTVALLTAMDEPLGFAIGNALEVKEAMNILLEKGGSPALLEVSLAIACEMLLLHQPSLSERDARSKVLKALTSGMAYNKFTEMVAAQGGDLSKPLPQCRVQLEVRAPLDGYVTSINALTLGQVAILLGAGRLTKDDSIDYGAGIVTSVRPGDWVDQGQLLATLHFNSPDIYDCANKVQKAFSIAFEPAPAKPLIWKTIR